MFTLLKIIAMLVTAVGGFAIFFMWDKSKDNDLMKKKLKKFWTPTCWATGIAFLLFLVL